MHFCQSRIHPHHTLTLFATPIPVVLILDLKYFFIAHIKALIIKCKNGLDILWFVNVIHSWRFTERWYARLNASIIYEATRYSWFKYPS